MADPLLPGGGGQGTSLRADATARQAARPTFLRTQI